MELPKKGRITPPALLRSQSIPGSSVSFSFLLPAPGFFKPDVDFPHAAGVNLQDDVLGDGDDRQGGRCLGALGAGLLALVQRGCSWLSAVVRHRVLAAAAALLAAVAAGRRREERLEQALERDLLAGAVAEADSLPQVKVRAFRPAVWAGRHLPRAEQDLANRLERAAF